MSKPLFYQRLGKIVAIAGLSFWSFGVNFALAQTFPDVSTNYFAYDAIEALYSQGVIQGYNDGTFHPEQTINRAETLKILLLSAGKDVSVSNEISGFTDVPISAWYHRYVLQAKKLGIIAGNPDGSFAPSRTVNFAEALKMLFLTNQIAPATSVTKNPFADVPKTAWYAPYFQTARDKGLLNSGLQPSVNPGKALTRAEVADLIYRLQQLSVEPPAENETQYATYYADEFQGKMTSSGQIFDQDKFTAAHTSLPFDTKVKVTNLDNQKTVTVTINDRLPASQKKYVLDLSKAAFSALAPLSRGVIPIKYEIITAEEPKTEPPADNTACESNYTKTTIPSDFYPGIVLDEDLPALYQAGEVFLVTGEVTENTEVVTIFWLDAQNKQQRAQGEVGNKRFSVPIVFSQRGQFQLGILPGDSGQTYISAVTVLSSACSDKLTASSQKPQNAKIFLENNHTILTWDNRGQDLTRVEIWQGEQKKRYIVNNGQTRFSLPYADFVNFKTGKVFYRLSSAQSHSAFSVDQESAWAIGTTQEFSAEQHYQTFNDKAKIKLGSLTEVYTQKIEISGVTEADMFSEAILILPNGLTEKVNLKSSLIVMDSATGEEIIPAGSDFSFTYTPKKKGVYLVELNADTGFAVINMPIYPQNTFPLIPDLWDTNERVLNTGAKMTSSKLKSLRAELLKLINQERQRYGFKTVQADTTIDEIALARAEDMAARNYFSHNNPEGKYVNDLKGGYGIKSYLSENISKDVNLDFDHAGLMRSAIHRANILNSNWARVGLGLAYSPEGYLIVVEEFAEKELEPADFLRLADDVMATVNAERQTDLQIDGNLTQLAQEWSAKLVNHLEDWFVISSTGESLENLINQSNVNQSVSSLILKGDFDAILEKIKENETILDSKWQTLGAGVSQNDDGTLNVTVLYGY